MPEIITIGETMAVLTPQEDGPIRYNQNFRMRVAGAESNVAAGVCKLGHTAAWISRLGEDELGHFVKNTLRAEGIDCSGVIMDESCRTGMMLKETGRGETRVFYYRENSAASHMSYEDINQSLLSNARILHLTGITPVLSADCREMTEKLVRYSKEHQLLLSFDPNIRRKLWKDKDYSSLLKDIALRAQIVMLGLDEGEVLFGTNKVDEIIDILFRQGSAVYVAVKDGSKGAMVAVKNYRIQIPPYPCRPVDPVGAGDAFNAGFLCGILEGREITLCGKMGGIAGAMATETKGDFEGCPDARQMKRLLAGEEEVFR